MVTTFALAAAAAFGSVLVTPPLRRRLLTRHIQRAFARALAPLSQTESVALEAGAPGLEASFFRGHFDPRQIEGRRAGGLSPKEAQFVRDVVDPMLEQVDDHAILQAGDLPQQLWAYLRQHRFFGLCIPQELGGLGFSHRAHSDIVMRIAAVSPSLAVTVMVPNSLGPAELLVHYGTPEQKAYWVPRLAKGEEIPCFALTSPWAGSDAASIPDVGVIVPLDPHNAGRKDLGAHELGLRLRWNKRYITLAPVATVMGLAFQARDPHGYLSDREELGITVALVPTSHPGVRIGKRHRPMNAAFMNGPTEGEDVLIPLDWVIGGVQQVGQGWRMLMECLSVGRAISLPALGAAQAKLAAVSVVRYAGARRQFKLPVGRFEAVAEPLARTVVNAHVAHCLRTFTVDGLDEGERSAVASAIAKYHLTELARTTVSLGMDVLGGKAVCLGPSNLLGTGWQLAPIAITVEGANILTRALIIFGQGAVRSHPFLLDEMRWAAHQDDQGLERFDRAFWAHMRKVVVDILRADVSKFTGTWQPSAHPDVPELAQAVRQAQRLAVNFSFAAEMLMLKEGGNLKRRELVSARLADVVSGLYMAAAVYRDAVHRTRTGDADGHARMLSQLALRHVLAGAEQALSSLVDNTPGALGWFLRQAMMPLGRRIRPGSDREWLALAQAALDHVEVSSRLEDGLLAGAKRPEQVHRDLAAAHQARCRFVAQGITDRQMGDAQWRSQQPAQVRDDLHDYVQTVDRLIQVDSFGKWR